MIYQILIRRLALAAVAATLLAVGTVALGRGAAAAAGANRGTAAPARANRAAGAPTQSAAGYVPGEVIVGYAPGFRPTPLTALARDFRTAARATLEPETGDEVVRLPHDVSVSQAIASLRRQPGVAYAVPDYIAHAAGFWIPDDPGRTHDARGWRRLQWNFLVGSGVDAPRAWANLIAEHRPGGRGVVVAILDTGVAFRDWRQFKESPDFAGTRFTRPCDLIAGTVKRGRCTNPYALDRDGHGTFIAGTVAEATNNRLALTGLAYGARIMPVRVLDANGTGDAETIARGIRYAAAHGAQVINLSLEFDPTQVTSGSQIPDVISAINYAHRRGVVVVAASGNDSSSSQIAYPAAASSVISVGATTRDRCLAAYSNGGPRLDLVAPGGDDDATLPGDPNCHPNRNLPDIYQITFRDPASVRVFGLPGGWYGTSMASAHVAATAALVIASGVIGRHPTPRQVLRRLEQTAQPLGAARPNGDYGYGLLDAGAATARPRTA